MIWLITSMFYSTVHLDLLQNVDFDLKDFFFFLLTNRQFCVPVCGNVKFYMWIINCASTVCKLFLIKLWISPHSALFILCVTLICWRWWKMTCFVVMSWISAKRWGDWTLNIITCFVGNVPKKKNLECYKKGTRWCCF